MSSSRILFARISQKKLNSMNSVVSDYTSNMPHWISSERVTTTEKRYEQTQNANDEIAIRFYSEWHVERTKFIFHLDSLIRFDKRITSSWPNRKRKQTKKRKCAVTLRVLVCAFRRCRTYKKLYIYNFDFELPVTLQMSFKFYTHISIKKYILSTIWSCRRARNSIFSLFANAAFVQLWFFF